MVSSFDRTININLKCLETKRLIKYRT